MSLKKCSRCKDHKDINLFGIRKSNQVVSSDPRVAFLYLLMRDHLPSGVVDKLIIDINTTATKAFTNGWLAEYAIDLVKRVDDAQIIKE